MNEADEYAKHNSALVDIIRTYHGLMSDARISRDYEKEKLLRRQVDNLIDAKQFFFKQKLLFIERDSRLQRILDGRERVKAIKSREAANNAH